MRKKINVITIALFAICAILAVYFGWIDDAKAAAGEARTWPISFILVGVAFVIGLIRVVLLTHANKMVVENAAPVRSVTIEDAVEVVDGKVVETTDKVALVHVDKVDASKVIVRVFKKPVSVVDAAGKVNK